MRLETFAQKRHTDPVEGAKAAAPAMTVARMASFMVRDCYNEK
jgi:hypothetical protein